MIQAEQWLDSKQAALGLSVFLGCSILGAMIRFGRHGGSRVVSKKNHWRQWRENTSSSS
jgi:hypothetical protein